MDPQQSIILKCPITDCNWRYESSFSEEQSFKLINIHVDKEHGNQQASSSVAASKAPKLQPPKIEAGVDCETWQAFKIRWNQYCRGSQLNEQMQSLQLFQCVSESLGNLLLKSNPNITDCSPNDVMEAMEKLAVIPSAKSVTRAELTKMCQGNDEPIRTFAAKVQGKAQTCGFTTKFTCTCNKESSVNYTQEIIKDVLLAGIADADIQTTVFDVEGIEEKTVNEIVALIERKEKARKAYHQSGVSAISSFKRSQNAAPNQRKQPPKSSPKVPCPKCKRSYRRHNGRNFKPFEICIECFRNHGKRVSTPSVSNNALVNEGDSDESTAALLQDKTVSVNVVNKSESDVSSFIRS